MLRNEYRASHAAGAFEQSSSGSMDGIGRSHYSAGTAGGTYVHIWPRGLEALRRGWGAEVGCRATRE